MWAIPTSAIAIALALLVASADISAKPGDINRCMDAQGQWVFTDQPCDIAVPDTPPADAEIAPTPNGSCPAPTLDDLLLRVRAALTARDFNALSVLYIWNELGAESVNSRIAVLQAIVNATLVRVQFERPETEPDPAADALAVIPKLPDPVAIVAFQTQGRDSKNPGPLIERRFSFYRKADCYWLR
jgi:hypothetical protein